MTTMFRDVLRYLRRTIARQIFGQQLLSHNRFLEMERIIGLAEDHWIIETGGRLYRVPSISTEIGQVEIERAVIMGSGPSLLMTLSFDQDSKNTYFALNGAARYLSKYAPGARYLAVCDRAFSRHNSDLIFTSIEHGAILLTTPECLMILVRCCPQIVRYFSSIRLFELVGEFYQDVSMNIDQLREQGLHPVQNGEAGARVGWSSDIGNGVFSGATVAFPVLQIAAGLAAREIEFHGLDLNGNGRAYQEEVPEPSKIGRHFDSFIRPSFEVAGRHLKGTGVKVRNNSTVCPINFTEIFDQ